MTRLAQQCTPIVALALAAAPFAGLGRLWLDSPIRRPLSQLSRNDGSVDPSPSPFPSLNGGPMQAADQHILIVDDEPDIRRLLRRLLEDEGYTVGEAVDGVDGLAQLRASPRRLVVLLDYKMPHMNGEELLKAVLADPQLASRHAIIFVTANLLAFSPPLLQMLQAAAIPIVQKPFHLDTILDEIERASARLQSSTDTSTP
ncbi:MAG: response regulator [Ktedonobacterales bacterium]